MLHTMTERLAAVQAGLPFNSNMERVYKKK